MYGVKTIFVKRSKLNDHPSLYPIKIRPFPSRNHAQSSTHGSVAYNEWSPIDQLTRPELFCEYNTLTNSANLLSASKLLTLMAPIKTAADDIIEYFSLVFTENKACYFM